MVGVKKLDVFTLKSFLLVFAGSFFICQFVLMMQFVWRYVEELIGKGLTLDILGKFVWYLSLNIVPQALPLAILLGSLISFGNLGERMELTAMKSAGVSLLRVMAPIGIFCAVMAAVSFHFQNVIAPKATKDLYRLLVSIKQQSPALEIPEGMFYNGVPNVNIYVAHKNAKTGMLYDVIIYKTDQGFDRAQIVLADSGKLEMTADKYYLILTMHNGEQFENLQADGAMQRIQANQPYDRETFQYKKFLISFNANFDMLEGDAVSGRADTKSLAQLSHDIDSMQVKSDSAGRALYNDARLRYFAVQALAAHDSVKALKVAHSSRANVDSLFLHLSSDKKLIALQQANTDVQNIQTELDWKRYITADTDMRIRKHAIAWHQKITLSLSCLFFFFIGAPLGAIIRKGGLGFPTVISVLIFILYYIINTSGTKLAKEDSISVVWGSWVSTMVLFPLGVFFTYKANNDSVVFNFEIYQNVFRAIFGIRPKRHIYRKEVIIADPDYTRMAEELDQLCLDCHAYNEKKHLLRLPSYIKIFFRYQTDKEVESFDERLEAIIEELSNSRDRKILGYLNEYPILFTHAHTSPFHRRWVNDTVGAFFPLGLVFWMRIWRYRLRLLRDMKTVVKVSEACSQYIQSMNKKENNDGK